MGQNGQTYAVIGAVGVILISFYGIVMLKHNMMRQNEAMERIQQINRITPIEHPPEYQESSPSAATGSGKISPTRRPSPTQKPSNSEVYPD